MTAVQRLTPGERAVLELLESFALEAGDGWFEADPRTISQRAGVSSHGHLLVSQSAARMSLITLCSYGLLSRRGASGPDRYRFRFARAWRSND